MIIAAALLFAEADMASALPAPSLANEEATFVATFTDICLKQMGDSVGQATAAVGSSWSFSKTSKRPDGMEEYNSAAGQLGIGGPNKACALTSELSNSATLNTVVGAMSAAIGIDGGQTLERNDSRYWLIAGPGDEEYVLSVKVSSSNLRSLATLWVQPRTTLNDKQDKAN